MTVSEQQRWVTASTEVWHADRFCAERPLAADAPRGAFTVEQAGYGSEYRPCKRCVKPDPSTTPEGGPK